MDLLSLLVFDVGLRRHTLLGPRGDVVRTFAFAVSDAVPFAQLRGVMADGSLLGTGFSQTPEGGPAAGRQRYGNPVYTFASDGQRPVVTGLESWGDAYFQLFEGGGFRVTIPPFAHGNQVLAAGSRIALASTESGEIRLHQPDGRLDRILRGVGTPERVTPTLHRAEVDQLMESEASSGDPAERRAFLLGIEVGSTPAMGRVHADGNGGLWIEPHISPGQGPEGFDDWTVLDAEGIPVARARLPRGFRPLEIGSGEVLGVLPDPLGVEQVMRLVW